MPPVGRCRGDSARTPPARPFLPPFCGAEEARRRPARSGRGEAAAQVTRDGGRPARGWKAPSRRVRARGCGGLGGLCLSRGAAPAQEGALGPARGGSPRVPMMRFVAVLLARLSHVLTTNLPPRMPQKSNCVFSGKIHVIVVYSEGVSITSNFVILITALCNRRVS